MMKYVYTILLVVGFTSFPIVALGATYGTFDINNCTNYVLSNANLTISHSATAWEQCRGTISKSSGKWYWEITVGTLNGAKNAEVGIFNSGDTLADYSAAGGGYWYYNGYGGTAQIYHNGVNTAYGASWQDGDVIGVALDLDNNFVRFYKNGASQGDHSISAGTYYANAGSYESGNGYTANFGASAFVYSVPAGFEAGLCAESSCSGGSGGGGGTTTPLSQTYPPLLQDFISKYGSAMIYTMGGFIAMAFIGTIIQFGTKIRKNSI